MKPKKLLSFILAVVTAISILPTFSLTAYAMTLNVKVNFGDIGTITLNVESGDSVYRVKQKIQVLAEISPDMQVLKFNEQELEDEKTLADYDIQKESTIQLYQKPRQQAKNITLGTSALSGYDSTNGYDYIYYGTYNDSPIKWRILDTKTNMENAAEGDGLFLLSDVLLGTGDYGDVYFQYSSHYDSNSDEYHKGNDPSDGNHTNCQLMNAWQGSDAQKWCQNFYSNNFTTHEQGAVLATTKSDAAFTSSTWSTPFVASANILSGDNVFFLSAEEVENGNYGFINDITRIANYDNFPSAYLLRSPHADDTYAGIVGNITGVINGNTNFRRAARPAFNLDSSKILFTSAAKDGKKTDNIGTLSANTENKTGEYKLTMLDESRNFVVDEISKNPTVTKGGTFGFGFSKAKTGENEYISVMLVKDDAVAYYGHASVGQSGEFASFTVPDDIALGTYELRLFNEQINGDYKTDYSSAFKTFTLNVVKEMPTASDFTFTPPSDLFYDGNAKTATVTSSKSGMGDITVRYYNENGTETEPINVGTYTVKIEVKEGEDYAATDLTADAWTFTVRMPEKNITLGTSALSGYDSTNGYDYIYYGTYNDSPIKWRILDTKTNMENAAEGDGLFLLSDMLLDYTYFQYSYHYFLDKDTHHKGDEPSDGNHENCSDMNAWQGSDAQKWCQSFYSNNLTTQEQGAVLATTKSDGKYRNGSFIRHGMAVDSILNGDKVFFLSAEEADNVNYGFKGNSARIAYYGNSADAWWVRTPDSHLGWLYNGLVFSNSGSLLMADTNKSRAARPAFNLDSSKILFTSAAKDGKKTDNIGTLSANTENKTGEYKLTLFDENRKLGIYPKTAEGVAVTQAMAEGVKGKIIRLCYHNARIGSNEYISAMIVNDNDEVLYYGRLKNLSGLDDMGTVDFTIPWDIDYGTYELRIFNEQINGDYKTDYSSDFETFTLSVGKPKATFTTEPKANTLTYNGTEQPLVTAGDSSEGTDRYSLEENGTYSIVIPRGTNADTYTVWYYIEGDADHSDSDKASVEVTISQATPTENPDKKTTARVKKNKTLAEATFTNGEMLGVDGVSALDGTFVWVDDTKTVSGNGTEQMTFTPNDANYAPITIDVAVSTYSSGGGGGVSSSVTRYTVKFDTDGGSTITNQTVTKNDKATEPTKPTKEGYTFDGWYTDSEFTTEYDFDTKVTKNITLYAKWFEDEIQEPHDDKKDDDEQKPSESEWKNPFTDVKEEDWFFDNVKYANQNGLMNGTTNTTFAPNEDVTRAMFVTVLWRAEGEPLPERIVPFNDVRTYAYYANAINWYRRYGIVLGISETEFAPDMNITREQIAVILYRYAKFKGYDVSVGEDTNILSYTDFDEISEYAIEAVQYAVGSGLMKGKTKTTLNPKDNATRAETAAMLQRFIESNK